MNQHLGYFDDEADGAHGYDAAVGAQNLLNTRNFPGDSGAKQVAKKAAERGNISAIPDKGKSRFLGVGWSKKNNLMSTRSGRWRPGSRARRRSSATTTTRPPRRGCTTPM